MEKPISLILDDFRKTLISAINESGLPACLMEPILKDLYGQVANLSIQELNTQKKQYDEVVMEEARKKRVEQEKGESE